MIKSKKVQKQYDQNDLVEEDVSQQKCQKKDNQQNMQKQQFAKPSEKNSKQNKEDMDKMSQKKQQRHFKMSELANTHLQQSIQLKNKMTEYDINQPQIHNNLNGNANQEAYDAFMNNSYQSFQQQKIQQNKNKSQLEDYVYQITQNGDMNDDYVAEQSLNNDIQDIKSNQLQVERKQEKKNTQNQNKRQVSFVDEKQKSNNLASPKIFTKQETNLSTQSNQFINESEVFQSQIQKQNTLHIKKQETIQNHFLESILISEDDYSSSDNDDDDLSMEIVEEQYEGDEVSNMSIESTQNKKEKMSNKQKMELRNVYTFYDKDIIESRILEEQDKKQQTRQKIHLKRKRKDLCAIPDENGKSSFQITCQRGKKKVLNSGLSVSIQHIPAIHANFKVSNQNIIDENSKSNLNNLISQNNRNNINSLLRNCSDIYSFSQMTTLISQFQYIKQETLVHHKIEDFRFISNIGKGSFGKVDLYEFVPLQIPIAVKTIQNLEEYARELYLMESLISTYMPQLFYYDETKMQLFMELGLCSLEDLRQHSQESGEYINDDQAFAILSQIVLAIEIFMDQKAFHSDIKPQNIVIRSKLDENKQINLELMIIDYGGASFDIEDYWIYYTPAFVCIPLWEKILQSGQVVQDNRNQKYFVKGLTFMDYEEDQEDDCDEKKSTNTMSSINQPKINSIQKEDNLFINQIYSQSSFKTTNLKTLDKQVSELIQVNEQQLKTNQILDSRSTNPSTTKNNLKIEQFSEINNNQNRNILSQTFSTQNTPKVQQNSYLSNQNTQSNNLANSNIEKSKNQIEYFPQKSNNKLDKDNAKNNQVHFADEYTSNKLKKLETLNMLTKQLESMQQYQKTYSMNYDKNSEKNPIDSWLTWEEIRYSEIYAGCRCVQYLILRKEDSEELFKKKNIQQFILKYHKLYPKTLKLIYKIYSKLNTYSFSKSQLNSLFQKTKVKDYKINIDPNLIFNISPVKKKYSQMQSKVN